MNGRKKCTAKQSKIILDNNDMKMEGVENKKKNPTYFIVKQKKGSVTEYCLGRDRPWEGIIVCIFICRDRQKDGNKRKLNL